MGLLALLSACGGGGGGGGSGGFWGGLSMAPGSSDGANKVSEPPPPDPLVPEARTAGLPPEPKPNASPGDAVPLPVVPVVPAVPVVPVVPEDPVVPPAVPAAPEDAAPSPDLPVASGDPAPPPVLPVQPGAVYLCSEAIDAALQSGEPYRLADALPIAQCANQWANDVALRQRRLVDAIYAADSTEYLPDRNSQFVIPVAPDVAQPVIVGDKGKILASLSVAGSGRSAAYGANILESFKGNANLGHVPAFKRLLGWLARGDAAAALPATLKIRFSGIDARLLADGFATAGVAVEALACDFSVPADCAAADADLLVLGSAVTDVPALETQMRQTLAAGKPVLYVHTKGWNITEAGRKMLAGIGMVFGGSAGNYWDRDAVAAGRAGPANLTALAQFDNVLPLIGLMASDGWRTDYDWSACGKEDCLAVPGLNAEVLAPSDILRSGIDEYSRAGRNPFTATDLTLTRLLLLWADVERLNIRYPMTKEANAKAFLKATVVDSLVAYARPAVNPQPNLGSFMGGAVSLQPVSEVDELISVTLPDKDGFTAIGRFALPGKALTIEAVDPGALKVSVRFNTMRTGSTRLWTEEYNRPRFISSTPVALAPNTPTVVSSPYGGTLQLSYTGAVPGTVVQLRVRGVARHPFLDASVPGADLAGFMQALGNTPFDWAEIKLPNAQIHTRVDKMKTALADNGYGADLARYLSEFQTLVLEDAYAMVGFSNAGRALPASVTAFCQLKGWDCTDAAIHDRTTTVRHYNADYYADCGIGCSGQPIDIARGLNPRGWTESHELGHILQKTMLNVYDRKTTEVSNNIFPMHKYWQILRESGVDLDTKRVDYRSAFNMLVAARQDADPSAGAYRRIWGSDAYAAQDSERLAFYLQWVHYWEERTGDKARGWDIFTLLYLHQRLFDKADWATYRDRLGYGRYADRPAVNGNDNLLIALSLITQRDQRPTFDLWGITCSADAKAQVESFGLAQEPALFYANRNTNGHDGVVKVDMSVAAPAWPF
jgi:hypothetical protein